MKHTMTRNYYEMISLVIDSVISQILYFTCYGYQKLDENCIQILSVTQCHKHLCDLRCCERAKQLLTRTHDVDSFWYKNTISEGN